MQRSIEFATNRARRKPLATCCAALFALAAPDVFAAQSWIVSSCADDGSAGTLRNAVDNLAQSGDTVDLSGLNCSNITLTTGAIVVTQDSLTLQGPGVNRFPIVGNEINDTILNHQGAGTLFVNDLTLELGNGYHYQYSVFGGCIFSRGSVALSHSRIDRCTAYDTVTNQLVVLAAGGGLWVAKNLTMVNSTITGNLADTVPSVPAFIEGGGAYVGGALIAKYSTIENNTAAFANYGNYSGGGGLFVFGPVSISNSTIDYNFSRYEAGGLFIISSPSYSTAITNSTISNNSAPKDGGMYSGQSTSINNSTIAFNEKFAQTGNAAGVTFGALDGPIVVSLHSTLIANNTYFFGGAIHNSDLSITNTSATNTVTFSTDVSQGNYNLVRAPDPSLAGKLPADTLIGVCPFLGRLKDNGGPTWTHALYSGSPAIDAGINNTGLYYDQRGGPQPPPNPLPPPPLAYDRHSGTRTDIGAFEVQKTDIIFTAGFEGCP